MSFLFCQILRVVIKQRERIIEETDLKDEEPSDDDLKAVTAGRLNKPSDDAMAKIKDYREWRPSLSVPRLTSISPQ